MGLRPHFNTQISPENDKFKGVCCKGHTVFPQSRDWEQGEIGWNHY